MAFSVAAIAGSYAERRITAISPHDNQSDGARSADRSAAISVDISCRRTAAAPRIPPPAVRICRAAACISSESESVVAWRSPGGPARSISSAYVVEAQEPSALNAPITVNGVLDRCVRPTVVVVIRRVVAVMVVVWLLLHCRSRLLLATSRWGRRPGGCEMGVVTKDSEARRFK